MTIALLVGRFQPFHFGHLNAVQNILKSYDALIIIIGSANKSCELKNPFSVKERMSMITNTMVLIKVNMNLNLLMILMMMNYGFLVLKKQ